MWSLGVFDPQNLHFVYLNIQYGTSPIVLDLETWSIITYLWLQCVLLGIRTMHVLTRYTIFLYDMRHGGINNVSWDKRGSASYYIELGFEMAALLIDLLHHLHMVSGQGRMIFPQWVVMPFNYPLAVVLEQHLPIHGQPSNHHAASLLGARASAKV